MANFKNSSIVAMREQLLQYLTTKASFSQEELKMIDAIGTVKKLRKKQYLLQEGDVWRSNAFILKGCLRTYRVDDKGTEHIIQFSVENWWTGDRESYLSGMPARSNIDAIEDTEVLLFSKEDFEVLCKKIPALNDLVNLILQRSFNSSQERIHASISYTAEEKYLDFINRYPDTANRVPQAMIASYLGISAETLSRVRAQLAKS